MDTNGPAAPFTHVDMVGIVVPDQDRALEWFTTTLGFEVREDNEMPDGGRWVTVGLAGQDDFKVLLQPPEWGPGESEPQRRARIGGDMLTMHTEDVHATVDELRERGVSFTTEPTEEVWGTYALFEDPFGNVHQVIEPPTAP